MKQSPVASLCDGIMSVLDRERERESREQLEREESEREARYGKDREREERQTRALEKLAFAFEQIARSLDEIRIHGICVRK